MNAKDFRRIALSFENAEEGSHMGHADFRVGGRIFATLASQDKGYGNLLLTLEQQKAFVDELPEIFLPVPGGWGRMGIDPHSSGCCERGCFARRATGRLEVENTEERKDRKKTPVDQSQRARRRAANRDEKRDSKGFAVGNFTNNRNPQELVFPHN